ncbi:uncharacterized protein L969DRAFT_560248 [Mixia osmundae IAM 14324]|uniref:Translation initiation factor IF-2, mitochondrial n=1 Tax=Mixia osmundae (strain CBS 9802 / IAM 14324 / JCM 22182 / KY 12970) TaxID=764103 RepID=G7DSF5_MIXOS|nr:uncharacterized protein L969DRAFT_560248 [Mixia osmundae IAM 14324]KEI37990.1 hypothetical protein L969DRAFT_560248 [Mixia osmundae IAM 14324]GAA93515.1 hypothetical protein E5Q_00156 [Mixia osmundae IAM 14324]
MRQSLVQCTCRCLAQQRASLHTSPSAGQSTDGDRARPDRQAGLDYASQQIRRQPLERQGPRPSQASHARQQAYASAHRSGYGSAVPPPANNAQRYPHQARQPDYRQRAQPSRQPYLQPNRPPIDSRAPPRRSDTPLDLRPPAQTAPRLPNEPTEQYEPSDDRSNRPHRSRASEPRKHTVNRLSIRDTWAEAARERQSRQVAGKPIRPPPRPRARLSARRVRINIAIPSVTSIANLSRLLGYKLARLQRRLNAIGFDDARPDRILSADDASLIALELGFEPVVDDLNSFDIYPDPPASDLSALSPRPPIVCIMGHVDHGKTTLLDTLRSTSVAQGEAGGITQHIGAFEVPMKLLDANASDSAGTVTFLDTPGHAAFGAMRSRGANITDIAVIVVSADDGVMPQTREVISVLKQEPNVSPVVAITKIDRPGVDIEKAKNGLLAAGLEIEEYGGDVPCVQVSAVANIGLDTLVETILAVSEQKELRVERQGVRVEARVIESKVDKGRGNVATLLVMRGTLSVSQHIVAGSVMCKVRQLYRPGGQAVKEAVPGQPVEVTGWTQLPSAGDECLEAKTEKEARSAIENRKKRQEALALLADVEAINEKRRVAAEEAERLEAIQEAKLKKANSVLGDLEDGEALLANALPETKELRLVIKADFSGTVEAVAGAVADIGNKEAKVKIVLTGVGDVSNSDIDMARTAEAVILGFNIKAPKPIQSAAAQAGVAIHLDTVIYRLIDEVKQRVIGLMPKVYDSKVTGEATIAQVFDITTKGRETSKVAGCKVGNGSLARSALCKVLRDGVEVYSGKLSTLKQGKKDVDEVRKGSECGISFEDWQGFEANDALQTYELVQQTRHL